MASWLNLAMGVVAALSSLVAITVGARHVDRCLQAWQGLAYQRHVIFISTIIPVYAILAWFCVLFPELALYMVLLIDSYEVFIIYHFMELMKSYMGGYRNTVKRIKAQPPVRLLFFTIQPHDNTLKYIQICVLQFIIAKPLISFVQMGLEHFKLLTRELSFSQPFLYLAGLKGLSLGVAMLALILFYRLARSILRSYNIISKFLIIKLVIFLNVFQNFIFGTLAARDVIPPSNGMSSVEVAYRILYFLVCIEMAVLAFFYPRVYPPDEKPAKLTDVELDASDLVSGASATRISSSDNLTVDMAYGSEADDTGPVPITATLVIPGGSR